MSFTLGSRNFYAEYNGTYFAFDDKKWRDSFVKAGAREVPATEMYEIGTSKAVKMCYTNSPQYRRIFK